MSERDIQRGDGVARFESSGLTWSERASCGELSAVIAPHGSERFNRFLHAVELYGAKHAAALCPSNGVILDFGCGTGRFLRFFGARGFKVIGTEITAAMVEEAIRFSVPSGVQLALTDGVSIPVPDAAVDLIWICSVLKYSLLKPGARSRGGAVALQADEAGDTGFVPAYEDIAREMFRVLKPGGHIINLEMYVDVEPRVFTGGFEKAGFVTHQVRMLHHYGTWFDRVWSHWRFPLNLIMPTGQLCAACYSRLVSVEGRVSGLRDYLIDWVKPDRD
jgi:SAM-dependent methyltransferase